MLGIFCFTHIYNKETIQMKKIIINENQFKRIESLILENKFKTNDIIKSDIIIIHKESGTDIKFEVMGNLPEGIFMRVLNKNSNDRDKLIQFSFLNLSQEVLNLKYTLKSESENVKGQLEWKNMSIKEIKAISIYNENKQLKDKINFSEDINDDETINNDKEEKSDKDYHKESLNSLINDLNDLIKDEQYQFNLKDGSDLFFTIIDKKPNTLLLRLDKTNGGESERYNDLINREIIFEPNDKNVNFIESNPDDENTVEFLFDINVTTKDNEDNEEDVIIRSITDFEESGHIDEISDKEVVDMILNDPNVRAAFMKKPTFFDLIRNKHPKGIIKAREILTNLNKINGKNDSKDNKVEKVTNLFKQNEVVKIELLGQGFSKTIDQKRYNLFLGEKYDGKVKDKNNDRVLININNLVISINSIKDLEENQFNCNVIIPVKNGENIIEKRTIKINKQY